MTIQDSIFLGGEGDQWFLRNREKVVSEEWIVDDPILNLIQRVVLSPEKVLDVGACTGYRLNAITKKYGCAGFALEPSRKAIEEGRTRYPDIAFELGTASEMPYADGVFDLVIVNFVLHWIDRRLLLRSVAEIDRVISDGGLLLIGDFYPAHPQKVPYHHLADDDVWTYKQAYARLFTESCLYEQVVMSSFDCATRKTEVNTRPEDRAILSILRKSLSGVYGE